MIMFWLGRRLAVATAAALALVLGAGLLVDRHGFAATPAAVAVAIENFSFGPATLTVARGTTITWTNKDDDPHTVTSDGDPKLLKSPALDTDESFSMTFDTAGTYKYFCSVHPRMQGTVIVQ